ncbi:TonB-dependent receptor plug domain-containing protein [Microbulbifer hydrolyticus]|uniref:Outer membrane receptor protein involved in Fe transport n=1 Tax=Microbulbifer hydrolyticus TaxID=48074 RepID=A0A6P1TFI2_9GAMM|nr:TonB-dependent receptor [Microbulbifer hydrolyticus]MBB5212357.1 outer membrane receptor protein involved in Fe transport [Microbulbifer hydrolyticus]QHQ39999.1 TonB-dependent receptor [Microbulbifer hydrolyticus]
MIKTKLSIAIAAFGTIAATGVSAQEAVPGPTVEEVIVTGSRIARDPLSTTGPITIVDSEAISRSGVGTIDELLNQLPSMGTTGINANDNNGGQGLAFVDLRNLGSARTLVLVNGRRFVSSASGVSSAVDMNNIPVEMIDRIEVLTDGASAVYGSDAVAGVINVVMKDSFDGVRINARAGSTSDGGGENGDISLTFGNEGERGSFIANISHSQRDEITFNDRDWAGLTSSMGPNGNIFTNYGSFSVGEDGVTLGDYAGYDIGQHMWLSGAMERTSATASGKFSITDSVELWGEASYTTKTTNQQLAAQPMYAGNGFVLDPEQHLPAEIQSQLQDAWQEAYDAWVANGSDPEDKVNPFPGATWVEGFSDFRIRPVAGGTRSYEQQTDTYRLAAGLDGDLANGWSWDTFFSYGKNEGDNVTANSYNKTRLNEIFSGEAGLDYDFAGGMSPEIMDYFRYDDRENNEYELVNIGASLSGDIEAIQFQGGALGFAGGIEYREESGEFNPSPETQSGETFGNQQDATGGDFDVAEVFAEFNLPILAGVQYAEELSIDAAVRYSDYSTFGGETTGKVGLVYAPIEDVRFRSSYSTSFRAPGIYELYSGSAQSYETLTDPCSTGTSNPEGQGANCDMVSPGFEQAGNQVPTNIGGNQELMPEQAKTFTAGIVWTPSFVDDLSITLDYYDISVEDAITSPDLQRILDDCFRDGIASACSFVTRGAGDQIVALEGAKMNIGQIDTRGVDIDVVQNLHFDAGRLAMRAQATRMLEYKEFNEQSGTESDYLGEVGITGGLYVDWRGLASVTWYGNDWDAGVEAQYFDGGVSSSPYSVDIDSQTYLNLRAGWDVNDNLRVSTGLDNVTNEEPQDTSGYNDWNSFYDFQGRYFWAGASYQF